MITQSISDMLVRDLTKLKEEINLYKNENDLWKLAGSINNTPGNLCIHLCGSLNHFIGSQIGKTGYVRERDKDFSDKNISRVVLNKTIDELIETIKTSLKFFTDEQMKNEYPLEFAGAKRTYGFILLQMLSHINYHLGQINYHRRILNA